MKIIYLIITTLLIVLNGLLNLKVLNLALTIPEILVVVFFLANKKTKEALLWHTIFYITSYSNLFTERFLFENNINSTISYNYAIWGISGIRMSMVISLLILYVQFSYKKLSIAAKHSVFYKLYRFFFYCVVTGFLLGIPGLFLMDYLLPKFLLYGYYALYCLCFAASFLYEYDTNLKDDLYEMVPYIIGIAVVFNFLCAIMGFKENLTVIGTSSIGIYAFILIPLLLFRKESIPILVIVGLQVYLMAGRTSGKQIYSLIFLFVAAMVLSFSKSVREKTGGINMAKVRIVFLLVLFSLPTLQQAVSISADRRGGNYEGKMSSVETLTSYFAGEGDMRDVDDSPYIRLAEISNIIYEDVRNPIYLLFGRGFGGYYRDELGLFNGYDLYSGAFTPEEIKAGRYSYGHDTFVSVPMLNGFIGFFMLIYLIVIMCKKSPQNYLYLTSLMFLLLWFYFDILMGVIGVMLLYAAEHKVQKV